MQTSGFIRVHIRSIPGRRLGARPPSSETRRHAEARPARRSTGEYNRRRRADERTSGRADERTSGRAWTKASKSGNSGNCVEVARVRDGIAVRHSKDPDGPSLLFTEAEFDAFLDGARHGEFDQL
ncbi:DUF397 domain-containing protein [Catenulispora pinisilvae]|uniref:DUF397 domain-containing protein n=1 Tax=Catenulispora pinisilvae TaxID=2705253 RepID=UPI001891FF9F|nr:DUF397 domain-containing protein [Catenulispora pinisilvae]